MKILEISQRQDLLDVAVQYFWQHWGSESNHAFYRDCIVHSLDSEKALPKFYIVLENEQIIGGYALLLNDIISRQDIYPWFACLYVNETHRGQGIAGKLLQHALEEAQQKGFPHLYLSTDLVDFYEKKGWTYFGEGYNPFGDVFKIYQKETI